jgi:hypothetical protein
LPTPISADPIGKAWGLNLLGDVDKVVCLSAAEPRTLHSLFQGGDLAAATAHIASAFAFEKTLHQQMSALLDSAFAHRFPAHPIFEQEVKTAALNKVLKEIELAAEEPQQRRFIEDRSVRQILGGFAGPLKLGTMNQGLTHFILDDYWANHFARLAAQQGGGAMTVKRLRALIDQPRPMGLPREVENLIILARRGHCFRISKVSFRAACAWCWKLPTGFARITMVRCLSRSQQRIISSRSTGPSGRSRLRRREAYKTAQLLESNLDSGSHIRRHRD